MNRKRNYWLLLSGLSCLLFLAVYVGTYLVWSRTLAWDGGTLWSFYRPPMGLMSIDFPDRYRSPGVEPEEGWRRWERLPGLYFWPCIWADEKLTGRRYLPTYDGV